jgi:integrase
MTWKLAAADEAKRSKTKTPVKLTNEFIANLGAPASGAETFWEDDARVRGFGIRVYAGGSRSFFINYRVDGRERRYTIGAFPRWSASAARERAKELRKLVDAGQDPAGEKRERREAPTVQDLIDRYVADHLPTKTAKGRENDERRMLAEIGRRLDSRAKVTDIHDGDIRKMHRDITASGRPVRANRILAVASKMFSLALVSRAGENRPWRSAALGNPCKGVERNREESKERFYSQPELAAISDALAEYPGQTAADCVRLIMLTGCRPGEAMLAAWKQFDAEPGYWIKPSAHTKQRKVHKLPLSPPALELVERLRQGRAEGANWVFPGHHAGEPIVALWHVWHFVRNRAGLGEGARLYDLRHSFASIGAGGGLSLPVIGRLLGHTQQRTTQRYAHLADDPLREAAARIAGTIAAAGKGDSSVQGMPQRQRL